MKTAQVIADLVHSQRITRLDLSKNRLKDEGVAALASALAANTSLVHLNLASNEITAKGIQVLCERGLSGNETLVSLDLSSIDGLSRNRLTHLGGTYLADLVKQPESNIQILKLSGTSLGNRGLDHLLEALQHKPNLVDLRLDQNEIVCNLDHVTKLVTLLETAKHFHTLDLSMNVVGDDCLTHLAPVFSGLKSLKRLRLRECRLTLKGLACFFFYLHTNLGLQELVLDGNQLRPDFSLKDETQKKQLVRVQEFFTRNTRVKYLSLAACQLNHLMF